MEIDGQRPGWLGAVGAGDRRAPRDAGTACGLRPVRVRTDRPAATARCWPGRRSLALNAWAAAWPWFGRRLVTWSSYIVLTEPIPDRLADLGWTGGEGVADARFTLHYLRTTPDGRIAIGGGGGRAGFGGRIGAAFTDSRRGRAARGWRACAGCSRRCATSASRTPGAARSTSRADHLPWFGSVPGGRSTTGTATAATASRRRVVGGRILGGARRRSGADDPALALPLADGAPPRAFPPEPARYLGARLIREAAVRRETIEERGGDPGLASCASSADCRAGSAITSARTEASVLTRVRSGQRRSRAGNRAKSARVGTPRRTPTCTSVQESFR